VTQAIARDPETMHGVPVFRGTRVPVLTLFEYLEGRDTLDEFLRGFPTVPCALAVEALEQTAARARLMKFLVDECIDQRLRLLFPGHDCQASQDCQESDRRW
jgi:uncharacterized protein (DUF433 family)